MDEGLKDKAPLSLDYGVLNEAQAEAVHCTEGPLLVLAGAGSGKTRVLTYRIAHLIQDKGVAPWEILAITFTNKAAAEMRERLGSLVVATRGMWVSTFHSMCVRMLRADCERLGFHPGFTIYDDTDAKRLAKEVMAELDIDPKRFPLALVRSRISAAKNELVVPGDFEAQALDAPSRLTARVYTRYQERLKLANAFDFDDLLLFAYLLLKHHPDVLEAYQQRFRYLHVDEYQDTNHAQYAITTLLAAAHRNIMVVGDDDQSIYSWRGADIRNILEFETDYPEAHVVKLEQNYRSAGNILAAANALIAHNQHRKHKELFTKDGPGAELAVYMASDERDEGRWIAGEIERAHRQGASYSQAAVFYRTNAQSRVIEDMFLRAGVPYRIVGGTRFFDRAEIRDVMAYLTLTVNPADDIAAKRVVNLPRRGIGKGTVEKVERLAWTQGIPFLQAAELALADEDIRPAARRSLGEFVQIIKDAESYSGPLRKLVEAIVDKSGLIAALGLEDSDEARGRIENIQEFFGVVEEFAEAYAGDGGGVLGSADSVGGYANSAPGSATAPGSAPASAAAPASAGSAAAPAALASSTLSGSSLADFIEWIRLRTDLDTMDEGGQAATLMTVHSSKGLEFDTVFVAGMEETLFPHMSSASDPTGLEEERRLAYVAITRARKNLHFTCASTRKIFGTTSANPVSRFVGEIPSELRSTTGLGSAGFAGTGWEKRGSRRGISGSGTEAYGTEARSRQAPGGWMPGSPAAAHAAHAHAQDTGASFGAGVDAGIHRKPAADMVFAPGDTVEHKVFGRGEVTAVGGGAIHVRFAQTGATKQLMQEFAPIVKVNR